MAGMASLITELAELGFSIKTGIFPEAVVDALAEEARSLAAAGGFRPARTGRADRAALQPSARGDSIHWISALAPSPAQRLYLEAMEAMRLGFNRELYLGLADFEAHYACYPPGAGYGRHLDRFADADERVLSCVLYLNRDWSPAKGGRLRLYLQEGHLDVEPAAGALVCFRSDTMPHEVLPASETRYSLTGWFLRRSFLRFPMERRLAAGADPDDESPATPPLAA